MSIRRFIRRRLRQAGWELVRFTPGTSEWAQLVKQLSVHKVDVVFDVGANVGQFARHLRDAGFRGRIISFEASAKAHSILVNNARGDEDWTIASRMAAGDRDGKTTINISQNSVSSSILPILGTHLQAEPESRYIASEEVNMRRLDSVASDFLSNGDRIFLKLDVQGFESEVLRGAQELLTRICGIRLEMSLVRLYEGEDLFDSMLQRLRGLGFVLWSLVPGFVDKNTGRLLQVDGVFFKT